MTVVEVLRKARELYAASPSHVPSGDVPTPGTVCAVTAIDRASGPGFIYCFEAEYALLRACGPWALGVVTWNAEHTTEEVLAAFDKAIGAVS